MTEKLAKIVFIDGGIGRSICSIPAIEKLAQTNKVIVIAAWTEVFANNPHIHKLYSINHPYLWDDIVKHGELLTPEPYTDYRYYSQQHHLIESFDYLINGTIKDTNKILDKPNLYLTPEEEAFGQEQVGLLAKQFKKSVVVFQPFGATLVMNKSGDKVSYQDDTHRSLTYDDAVSVAKALSDDFVLLNMTFVNFDGVKNIITPQLSLRQWFSVMKAAHAVIGVDSAALHIANAFEKPGVAILGASFKQNVGYDKFQTFQKMGYPKSFRPMRIAGFVDLDQDAMIFPNFDLPGQIKILMGPFLDKNNKKTKKETKE